jgi:biotin carboxylase
MRKIAILGASYLQEPLVLKANQMGLETHCFAWDNKDAVCKEIAHHFYAISVLDKDKILKKCKEIDINGITTIATDICIPTISFVAEKMNLIANSLESSIGATNKSLMRKRFAQGQINSPKYETLENFDLKALGAFEFPVIVKPTDRSGSRGVTKVDNISDLEAAFDIAKKESIEKKVLIEEYINGEEISVECISWKGQHYFLAITDKITTGEPYFVELQHHQPSLMAKNIQKKIKSETLKALDALEIKYGASHSEFKITSKGEVVAIEVGARMGGDFIGSHLVALSTGYDFLKGVIDVALNEFEEPILKTNKHSGVYYLSKETEYLKPYFIKNNAFDIEKKILKTELYTILNSNDRSGYLIYQDNNKIIL